MGFKIYRYILLTSIVLISIGLSYIIYLIFSNISQSSVENINPRPWAQLLRLSNPDNVESNFVQHTKNLVVLNVQNRSYICDRKRNNDGTRDLNFSSEIDDFHINILRPYCDLLPVSRTIWIPTRRYNEDDIIFIIYTSKYFYQSRAMAVRDTWLSRVTNKYFLGGTPYPALPVTVIEGVAENYSSNIRKISHGLQIAYQNHSEKAKFYFLASCDTYVNVPHLLKQLEAFNYKKPLIIGGSPEKNKCYVSRNLTKATIEHPSGGGGFLLSAQMMKLLVPKFKSYFENDWSLTEENARSDVALSCLANSIGVKATLVSGFWKFNPEQTLRENGKEKFYVNSEPNTFHNINPLLMHVLDEFYIHQLLDRLGNARDFNELMKFTRHFVNNHYQFMRIRRRECTLPPV